MKKPFLFVAITSLLLGCNTTKSITNATKIKTDVQVAIDLANIVNDKVAVTIVAPTIATEDIYFRIPKTVPGTYSTDNYGKYIDDLKAFDKTNKALLVTKTDDNSWKISNSKNLDKITYLVNDTFEKETGAAFVTDNIFSPAGTNIDKDKNIMLNTHGFVGYFDGFMANAYTVTIAHPAKLWGATTMTDTDTSDTNDVFTMPRYAELLENPIMYAKQNSTLFNVNGMDIQIAVYSPNNLISAQDITPGLKKVMTAQKNFLGNFSTTNKYSVLIYLTDVKNQFDAKGFGALEHPRATTVVMPEIMGIEDLSEQLKDIVSHEFFHIVTPLTIHSEEIQNFDFNNPKMSEHLWLYEGVTEYFSNLFQVNQGLIAEDDFYTRMAEKIENAKKLDDTMPFTKMSKNVLTKPYKDQYLNVYEKGALIGMCLDIVIRGKSNGQRGILDLIKKLSLEYGVNKAFNDNELFAKITELTYPEVGEFLNTYVSGETPIPYDVFFAKMGVSKIKTKKADNVFLVDQKPILTANPNTKEIIVIEDTQLTDFMTSLGLKGNDIIKSINGKNCNVDTIIEQIIESEKWKEGDPIEIVVKRDGKDKIIKGKVKLTFTEIDGYQATDDSKKELKNAWLKG
jgi:predicted metalloprotease with PDZ domain